MSIFEIISAIILILACVFIVVVVLLKDTKTQMSQSISGTSSDSFYQKNAGRTKEAILNKATVAAAVIFFVLAVAVNLINVYGKKTPSNTTTPTTNTTSTTSTASDTTSDTSDTSGSTSDTSNTSTASDTSDTSAASSSAESTSE
ncbi:MAG: preprotein translocase subunit SecG [Oscillospiraceae bacterium]|nr:preprotein translocase subunit SecG [Oscillospiraceae bacterium]